MLRGIRMTARMAGRARWAGEYLQEAQNVRPAQLQRAQGRGASTGVLCGSERRENEAWEKARFGAPGWAG